MISGSTDIRQLSQSFIQADRASQDSYFNGRQNTFQSKIRAYSTITTKINDLQEVLKELSKGSALEEYGVTQNQEGYAKIEASGNVATGEYRINVSQLASAHQVTLDFASETDPLPASGIITLGSGGSEFSIDLSTLSPGANLADLRSAINSSPDNTGVQASIIRTGGSIKLMIGSEETGAANNLTLSTNGDPAIASIQTSIDNKTVISQAKDAIIYMGENNALELTSSSNTFDNVIDGLKIDVSKVHAEPTESLIFKVGQDSEATEKSLKGVVDKYNAVMLAIDGSKNNGLTGDATTRVLSNQIRRTVSDFNVGQMGIEFDRRGRLNIDSEKLEEFLETNPDGLTEILGGETGMIKTLSERLDTFVKGNDAMLNSAKSSLESNLDNLNDRMSRFDMRMEQQLNRYISQFSAMQTTISQMQQTSNMFA
jgi:flagellar hook-associated protein 2